MKSLIKGSLAAALAAVATAVSADYLAWRVSGSENRDYSYAQIYYASSYNDLNNSTVYDSSTALNNYLDNQGTSTSALADDYSPSSATKISKGAMDTGASFLVDTSQIANYGTQGYSFYVLLFNAQDQARYVTDLGPGGSTIATYSDLANNYVDALTVEALHSSAVMAAEGFVIPEPGSGLLLLVGSAMMLLRRKRAA